MRPAHRGFRLTLTNRAIVAAGIVGGVATAIGSMFFAGPERVVQRATGVGDRSPTVEELAGDALVAGDTQRALDLYRQVLERRPGSTFRVATLAAALARTGEHSAAIALIREHVGADDSATASAFASGETPVGDQRVPFLGGRWAVSGRGRLGTAQIYPVAGGRAFLETWGPPEGDGLRVVYIFDAPRMRWVRASLNDQGGVYWHSGVMEDGRMVLDFRRFNGREEREPPQRMVIERIDGTGGFVRRFEVLEEDKWRFNFAMVYMPWVPLIGVEFADDRFAEPVF